MKKLLSIALALTLLLCAAPAFADVAEDIRAGEQMTFDELLEKAAAEKGTFVVYANTSRILDAAEMFALKYDIPYAASNKKDQDIYKELRKNTGADAADMVMIQDGAQLAGALEEGIVLNFVPAGVRDTLDEADQQPALVHQYFN